MREGEDSARDDHDDAQDASDGLVAGPLTGAAAGRGGAGKGRVSGVGAEALELMPQVVEVSGHLGPPER